MTPDQYCQKKIIKSGSSFYYSFLYLSPKKRLAITALYAFCREVDDAVDETKDPTVAQNLLEWWKNEISQMFDGIPSHPVSKAIYPHLKYYNIEKKYLFGVIKGMEMDLNINMYQNFSSLENYCWHVASTVGVLSAKIFGYKDKLTLKYAEKLGIALQLINIIRDVGEDARMNRIYLPQNELDEFKVSNEEIFNLKQTKSFNSLMNFQYQRAKIFLDEALDLLPLKDKKSQRAGLVMAAIYRSLLEEIRLDGFNVLKRKVSLTPIRKLLICWLTIIKN